MNLLDLFVKISCKDEASSKLGGIASGITGTMTKAAGVVSAVMGSAAVAGTVAIAKSALDAYASYEQLVGGVETLFGKSSGVVQRYAENAYKVAGVSANTYMEQATAFSASLIQSLGGDTAKAAEYANTAINDMSDNANKMGTDIESIQMTYQSLMRGNYAMLDNLKLGYGGTKAELERLVEDAEKLTGQALDPAKFSDVITAIHAVQENMGITGTTAKEAATTIEGSVNTMKAAWDNWLASLGREDVDMSVMTDRLVESVITAGQNIIPRVGIIMTSLGEALASYAPEVAQRLYDALMSVLPDSVSGPLDSVVSSISDAFGRISESFGTLLGPAAEALNSVVSSIGSGFEVFSQAVSDLVIPAIDQLAPAFEYLFEAIQNAQPLLEFLSEVIGVVLASALSVAIQLFAGIVEWVAIALNGFQQLYDFLSGFVGGVVNFFTVDVPAAFQTFVDTVSAIPGQVMAFLDSLLASVGAWVSEMGSNASKAGSDFVNNVVKFVSSLPGRVGEFLSSVIGRVKSFVSDMASNASSAASRFASKLISGLQSIPGRVVSIGRNIVEGMVDGVVSYAGRLIDAIGGAVNDAIDWAKGLLGIASPSKVFRKIFQFVMEGARIGVEDKKDEPVNAISDVYDSISALNAPTAQVALAAPVAASGPTYNLYLDGSLVRVDSRIGMALDKFVQKVADELDLR